MEENDDDGDDDDDNFPQNTSGNEILSYNKFCNKIC